MSIGVTDEHEELAASLRKWAASLGAIEAIRGGEGGLDERFDGVWGAVEEMGVTAIAVPESAGGGGGTILDQAVALEACAYELVPGGLLGAAIGATLTGVPGRHGVQVRPGGVVWDGGTARSATPVDGVDLSARHGAPMNAGEIDERLRRTAVTLAAAEASGVARWCLETAVEYAKVREQFGKPIGSFQAIKHLCAEMLETAEAVTAAAWDAACAADGDDEQWEQWGFAVDVAQAICFAGAVEVAKSCIQVLGGIGFTYEHDAHFYLRRAVSLRALVGPADEAAARLTAAAVTGVRRRVDVDLAGLDEPTRPAARATAERIAALPAAERRPALVETGYLTPHWPTPYGLAADPVTQVVIDQELARAGVTRPDLVIAGWAVPDDPAARHRCAARTVRAPVAARRAHLVPAVLRARFRLRPRLAPHEGHPGRRRLAADRTEGLDVGRRAGGLGHLPGPDRPGGAAAQGHHLLPRRHVGGGHRRASAAGDHGGGTLQRGVPRRGVRPRRVRGGRARRRLATRADDARQRASGDGQCPARQERRAGRRAGRCGRRPGGGSSDRARRRAGDRVRLARGAHDATRDRWPRTGCRVERGQAARRPQPSVVLGSRRGAAGRRGRRSRSDRP